MKIRNMSVTKHHDKQSLELHVEIEGRKIFSVFIDKPMDSDELPVLLAKAGTQLRNLINNEVLDASS